MKVKFILLIVFVLLGIPTGFAQTNQNDDAAIRQLVESYFDGWKNNDVESMKKAFNPKAKWFVTSNMGDLTEIKMDKVFANLADNARQKAENLNIITRILSSDVTGAMASVKVEFEYPDAIQGGAASRETQQKIPGVKQTEYLSLIKFKDGWQIVSKVLFLQSRNALVK